jgi:hypothetical protein
MKHKYVVKTLSKGCTIEREGNTYRALHIAGHFAWDELHGEATNLHWFGRGKAGVVVRKLKARLKKAAIPH